MPPRSKNRDRSSTQEQEHDKVFVPRVPAPACCHCSLGVFCATLAHLRMSSAACGKGRLIRISPSGLLAPSLPAALAEMGRNVVHSVNSLQNK